MKTPLLFLVIASLFLAGCGKNGTTVVWDDTPNRIVEVNFSPVTEEGKENRIQMEIIMELNSINPAYPTGGSGINAEKLELVANRY